VPARFIPPTPIRERRELARHRTALVQQRTQAVNRLQKVLEGANSTRASVATSMLGKRARGMLNALLAGEQDVAVVAELARGPMRAKIPQLPQALTGHRKPSHQVLLRQILAHMDFLEAAIAQLEGEIEQRLHPYEEAVHVLQSMPGVKPVAAATLVAELGTDRHQFPSACTPPTPRLLGSRLPRQQAARREAAERQDARGQRVAESGLVRDRLGQRAEPDRLPRGAGSAPHAATWRLPRADRWRALAAGYHLPRAQDAPPPSQELGPAYFDKREQVQLQRHHVRRLEQLGYAVTLAPRGTA
jgi:hypothetical protein